MISIHAPLKVQIFRYKKLSGENKELHFCHMQIRLGLLLNSNNNIEYQLPCNSFLSPSLTNNLNINPFNDINQSWKDGQTFSIQCKRDCYSMLNTRLLLWILTVMCLHAIPYITPRILILLEVVLFIQVDQYLLEKK